MEEPGGLPSMGSLRVGHDWATSLSLFTFMHWRRKWQPLQCSCLENPRDGGAWWAAVYGVAQSRTRLKWLSSSRSRGSTGRSVWKDKTSYHRIQGQCELCYGKDKLFQELWESQIRLGQKQQHWFYLFIYLFSSEQYFQLCFITHLIKYLFYACCCC